MPPKAAAAGPSKKTEQKKKDKTIDDKTFGLKNKKGAKQQKFVQQVQCQVKGTSVRKVEEEKALKKKAGLLDELGDMSKLLKPVAGAQTIAKDVDPKSILCLFFKQGLCTKGNKCKFSHDLNIEQKTVKRNLYVDSRDVDKETNEDWSEEKLTEVAETKHGEADRKRPNQTDIVCKYFIEAVENSKYGWFWECPNGGTCIYRHALPPGFILKKDRKNMEDLKKATEISLEELIEKERQALGSSGTLTKVTLQSFVSWKKRKLREKKEKVEAEEKAKKEKAKSGKHGGMSGRDLFIYNPDLIQDDDEADDVAYEREADENDDPDVRVMEIDANFFTFEGMELMDQDDDDDGPGASTLITDEVGKMAINADLFDADDIPEEDEDDDES